MYFSFSEVAITSFFIRLLRLCAFFADCFVSASKSRKDSISVSVRFACSLSSSYFF